jgi:hypothetical protein
MFFFPAFDYTEPLQLKKSQEEIRRCDNGGEMPPTRDATIMLFVES